VHSPDALRRAVATQDVKALTVVPGIGTKTAQRIMLELGGKLGDPGDGIPGVAPGPLGGRAVPSWRDQVQSGLVNLGWSARDADAAITAVEAEHAQDGTVVDVSVALRSALRKLSRP